MRVLHVAQPTTEGVARVVAALAADQVERGWEVAVACPAGGELSDAVQAAGAAWLPWEATRSPGPGTLTETARLRSVLRAERPEVVHLHSAKAGLAGRLLLRGRRPTVFMPHAWSFEAVQGPVRTASLAWERWAARWTDLLVCVSRSEQRLGSQHGVVVPRTEVVPNGVDLSRYRAAGAAERAQARSRLGRPAGPLAVCVGRLARQKGQDLLLEAWPAVRTRVPSAELVLVGDGPDRAALEQRAGAGARLVGGSDAVADWLTAADVVVVPSRWEGMALVPLEAMATGRSVVAFDVTGVAESVPADAGAVVPLGDVAALATAVADRLTGSVDADAEGRRGRAHVEEHHDVRRSAERLASLCAALATTHAG